MPESGSAEYRANRDGGSAGVHNLIGMLVMMTIIGVFLLILGLVGDTDDSGLGSVHVINPWMTLAGGALLFLAIQGSIGLALFLAWRREHRGLANGAGEI